MENSKIAWTDHTMNFWMGCTKVSPGCANCYAETLMDKRFGRVKWGPQGERVKTGQHSWVQLRQWEAKARRANRRQRVFVCSLADFFEDRPEVFGWRNRAMKMMTSTRMLDYLILTKRPDNVIPMVPPDWLNGKWPQHIWIGTSVESQEYTGSRLWPLHDIPGKHFVSAEPLINPMIPFGHEQHIDWLIVGGESGNSKRRIRPMDPNWARALRDWAREHDIPFFMKQMGAWDGLSWHGGHGDGDAIPPDLRIQQTPFSYVEAGNE